MAIHQNVQSAYDRFFRNGEWVVDYYTSGLYPADVEQRLQDTYYLSTKTSEIKHVNKTKIYLPVEDWIPKTYKWCGE